MKTILLSCLSRTFIKKSIQTRRSTIREASLILSNNRSRISEVVDPVSPAPRTIRSTLYCCMVRPLSFSRALIRSFNLLEVYIRLTINFDCSVLKGLNRHNIIFLFRKHRIAFCNVIVRHFLNIIFIILTKIFA